MGNSRNLANLLGTGSTIATAKIADDAITAAKIATDAVVADGLSSSAIASGDLPTGTVLQVKADVDTAQVLNSVQAYTDSGLSVSITPSSSTNYFLVVVEGHFASQNNDSDKGFGFNIYKDGTAVSNSPNDGATAPYDWYQDDSGNGERYFLRQTKSYYAATGTTSSVTFTMKFTGYSYATGDDVYFNYASKTESTLVVYEIAG